MATFTLHPHPSIICPKAGLGLTIKVTEPPYHVKEGTIIGFYGGVVMNTKKVFESYRSMENTDGGYLLRVGFRDLPLRTEEKKLWRNEGFGFNSNGDTHDNADNRGQIIWLDATCKTLTTATPNNPRYINDSLLNVSYNCKFIKDPNSPTASALVRIICTRDVLNGEELFVDYGKGYWGGINKGFKLKLGVLREHYKEIWVEYGRVGGEGGEMWPDGDFRSIVGE